MIDARSVELPATPSAEPDPPATLGERIEAARRAFERWHAAQEDSELQSSGGSE